MERVETWQRPAYRPGGEPAEAAVTFFAFADEEVPLDLDLTGLVPPDAPADQVDLRLHRHAADPGWIDGFRSGPLRTMAEGVLPDMRRLDAATCCYSVQITVADPADLAHLQLAWAVAGAVVRGGAFAVLDGFTHTWHPGDAITALDPHRPFAIQREIALVAENQSAPGFGHPVHTRGMIKFGCPDLIAGVPADRIQETGRLLNHLARMLAEGDTLTPGRQLRVDGTRTLTVSRYVPDDRIPDVRLIGDGLLLTDV